MMRGTSRSETSVPGARTSFGLAATTRPPGLGRCEKASCPRRTCPAKNPLRNLSAFAWIGLSWLCLCFSSCRWTSKQFPVLRFDFFRTNNGVGWAWLIGAQIAGLLGTLDSRGARLLQKNNKVDQLHNGKHVHPDSRPACRGEHPL